MSESLQLFTAAGHTTTENSHKLWSGGGRSSFVQQITQRCCGIYITKGFQASKTKPTSSSPPKKKPATQVGGPFQLTFLRNYQLPFTSRIHSKLIGW